MSKWNHAICVSCWNEKNPGRPAVSIVDEHRDIETCCYCGEHTRDGIYVRANPNETEFCEHDKELSNV